MDAVQEAVASHAQVLAWVGLFYLAKLAGSAACDLWDGARAFLLPLVWRRHLPSSLGPWALVTGCTRGIGREYALQLARRGMNVVLAARDPAALEEVAGLVRAEGVEARVVLADFATPGAVGQVVEGVADLELGLLVNNVGVMGPHFMPFLDMEPGAVEEMVRVNAITCSQLCHALLPAMVARGRGAVVNIASIMAFQPVPYAALYTATKYFLQGLTLSLAEELRGTGVTVQEIDPGHVVTGLTKAVIPATPFPSPATFARAAVSTLGHSPHTCGWWGHSLHRLATDWLLPRRSLPALMGLMGWGQWRYATSGARKKIN